MYNMNVILQLNFLRTVRASLGVCLLCFLAFSCDKAGSSNGSEPEKAVKHLFEVYKEQGPRSALDQLLRSNKYISEANVDSVGAQLERLTKDFGDYQGYEIVSTRNYGEGIMLITCIVKYSQLPIRFNFRFYQPGNGWRIQDFNYQTSFMKELEQPLDNSQRK
jgi:hypothetical protein